MAELIQPVKGMNDVLADQAPWWAKVESVAHGLFAGYGYRRVYLPVLERTELFSRSIGELTDIVSKEMFTFDDHGDSLTLRPEGTAGVVRAALSNGLRTIGSRSSGRRDRCSGARSRRRAVIGSSIR
jgi:histidyl-tRNA synthetase